MEQIRESWRSHRHTNTFESVEKLCWKYKKLVESEESLIFNIYIKKGEATEMESELSRELIEFSVSLMNHDFSSNITGVNVRIKYE